MAAADASRLTVVSGLLSSSADAPVKIVPAISKIPARLVLHDLIFVPFLFPYLCLSLRSSKYTMVARAMKARAMPMCTRFMGHAFHALPAVLQPSLSKLLLNE